MKTFDGIAVSYLVRTKIPPFILSSYYNKGLFAWKKSQECLRAEKRLLPGLQRPHTYSVNGISSSYAGFILVVSLYLIDTYCRRNCISPVGAISYKYKFKKCQCNKSPGFFFKKLPFCFLKEMRNSCGRRREG